MTAPAVHRRPAARSARLVKRGTAADAIGTLAHGQDVYILTYGQFSLIDALVHILDQTGPADVILSSWTAADAHLQEAAHMLEAASIRSLRMIVDRSFRTRQPGYYRRMQELFGADCVREIRSHAKFMVISNDNWRVVVRTSMNLNENPRFENIEISEDPAFAAFMTAIADEIFATIAPGDAHSEMPELAEAPPPYRLVRAPVLELEQLTIPRTTHAA
jgi:hypothetical protein